MKNLEIGFDLFGFLISNSDNFYELYFLVFKYSKDEDEFKGKSLFFISYGKEYGLRLQIFFIDIF